MAVLLASPAPLVAQRDALPLAYRAAQFACARWHESLEGTATLDIGVGSQQVRLTREGSLLVRGEDTTGGVWLEAWYDSLTVSRTVGQETLVPDADFLLGAIYKGILGVRGGFRRARAPVLTDDLRDVFDLTRELDDFFPLLPARRLQPGERWREAGLTMVRLPDSLARGRPIERYRYDLVRADSGTAGADTVRGLETTEEEGSFLWDPERGPVARERRLRVEADVPSGPNRRPRLHSVLEFRVLLERGRDGCGLEGS